MSFDGLQKPLCALALVIAGRWVIRRIYTGCKGIFWAFLLISGHVLSEEALDSATVQNGYVIGYGIDTFSYATDSRAAWLNGISHMSYDALQIGNLSPGTAPTWWLQSAPMAIDESGGLESSWNAPSSMHKEAHMQTLELIAIRQEIGVIIVALGMLFGFAWLNSILTRFRA